MSIFLLLMISPIPSISYTALDRPPRRLCAVGGIIVAWPAIPFFLVIDRVIVLKLRIEKAQAGAGTTFMASCAVVSFFFEWPRDG
jgi:hypothetical protein